MNIDVSKLKKMTLKEIQMTELDILKNTAEFCDENNIRYYLGGGTLLGAVRHKGFIPWDDDIDIIMPRPDYMRFIELYDKNYNKNYKISSIYNNPRHIFPFAKIYDKRTLLINLTIKNDIKNDRGIYIDIFPSDGLPDDIKKAEFLHKRNRRLKFLAQLYSRKYVRGNRNIIKTVVKFGMIFICRIFKSYKLLKTINNYSGKYDFETSEFVSVSVGGNDVHRERIPYKNFVEQITVEFEGEHFKASKGYHENLTNMYGDYMKLPPVEKQKPPHPIAAYWK